MPLLSQKSHTQETVDQALFEIVPELYEAKLQALGMVPAGVDEVGRGCLAGPVVAAAVILPPSYYLDGLKDSKLLSATQRERLFEGIVQQAVSYAVSFVDSQTIDQLNILRASLLAMRQAVDGLSTRPQVVLVDGNQKIPLLSIPQKTVIRGDQRCATISAASIIAKVSRDRWMAQLEETYPGYFFSVHKGYPTKQHRQAIERLGMTPLHRLSFKQPL